MEGYNDVSLALKYRRVKSQISRIRNGKNWKQQHKEFFEGKVIPKSLDKKELTNEEKLDVVWLCDEGKYSNTEIGGMISRDISMIGKIRRRETWLEVWKEYDLLMKEML